MVNYHSLFQLYINIYIINYYIIIISSIPLADPLVVVISTIASLEALLLSIRTTDNGVMFSLIEYCDWLNDNTAPIDQYINNKTQPLTLLLLSSSLIVTSVALIFPIITPQTENGVLSVSLSVSLHSITLSFMMFIVKNLSISPAAIIILVEDVI